MAAEPLEIKLLRLEHGEGLSIPRQASEASAGLDLRAAVPAELFLQPGERLQVPTGVALEIPAGWEGQVRPRSGLASKHGITLLNSPGTIDSDYRGEIQVILVNLGNEPFTVRRGDRIAQLVFAPVARVKIVPAASLGVTGRGDGGFGSTGSS